MKALMRRDFKNGIMASSVLDEKCVGFINRGSDTSGWRIPRGSFINEKPTHNDYSMTFFSNLSGKRIGNLNKFEQAHRSLHYQYYFSDHYNCDTEKYIC
jgi:hypothetical protein